MEELHFGNDPRAKDENVFVSLWSNVRDAFFAPKLPPLVLESKPIPVPDRMKFKRDPMSTGIAIVMHALIILFIAWVIKQKVFPVAAPAHPEMVSIDVPPMAPPKAQSMGGGGGQRGPTPVTQGHLPKFEQNPIVPPNRPPLEQPKIHIEAAVDVQTNLHMANNNMPNIGMPNSPVVGSSTGNGSGTGLGSGNGNGLGPGTGGNYGGGLRRIGGGVSAPILIHQVDPEFSEEARKAKYQGNVLVNLVVDANGNPQRIRVIRPLGMGLDEKAMEAVRQYKFKPAMENGKPVPVELNVDVNFQIL